MAKAESKGGPQVNVATTYLNLSIVRMDMIRNLMNDLLDAMFVLMRTMRTCALVMMMCLRGWRWPCMNRLSGGGHVLFW